MGNELSSCACGSKKSKKEIEDRTPYSRLDHGLENGSKKDKKGKRKKLSFKKSKNKGVNSNQHLLPDTHSNSDVKDVIRIDIEKPVVVKPSTECVDNGIPLELSPLIPAENVSAKSKSQLSKRRVLFPPTSADLSNEECPVSSRSEEALPPRSPQVVRFVEGDIEPIKSSIIIYEDFSHLPEPAKKVLKMAGNKKGLEGKAKAQVVDKLMEKESWRDLNSYVREQFDIIHVANPTPSPDLVLQETLVVIQRQYQRVYVIVSSVSNSQCKLQIFLF